MYGMIIEPLDATPARVTTRDGVLILEVVGLGDGSPILTISQTCADCGKEVTRTTYDTREVNPAGVVFQNGEASGEEMRAHWAAHRNS